MADTTRKSLNYTRDLQWVRHQLYGDPRLKAMRTESNKLFTRCKNIDTNHNGKLEKSEVSAHHDWRYTLNSYRELVQYLQMFRTPFRHPLRTPTAPKKTIELLKSLLSRVVYDMGTFEYLIELDARVTASERSIALLMNNKVVFGKVFAVNIKTVEVTVKRTANAATFFFKVHLTDGRKINVQHTRR